jgi:hypothetical protein
LSHLRNRVGVAGRSFPFEAGKLNFTLGLARSVPVAQKALSRRARSY